MQTLEYRTMDKSQWGIGPWQDEPDKRQWQDEATGLPCLIKRSDIGALCGYVGVPPGHPAHGKGYSAVDADCHGGLTYAAFCQSESEPGKGICRIADTGEPDRVWWLGFDCAHAGDYVPGLRLPALMRDGRYCDLAYVTEQCRQLAAQLQAMSAA